MSTGQGLGALVGAVLGGIIGSIIPGVGTLLGAYVGMVLGYAIGGVIDPVTPDVNQPGAPIQGLQIVSNEIGSPICDGVGTVKIAGHLLAYGKEYSVPIEQEASGGKGGGGGESVVTGHNYYMSWCLGIMIGPASRLYSIFANEKLVWGGSLGCPISGGEETITIEGMGKMTLYFGTEDQVANPKVAEFLTDATLNSPMRGLCWAFFEDCFIGTFNRMPTMFFVVNKAPALTFSDKHQIETFDYNPIHAIWWILTRITGLPEAWLHEADFAAVAQILYDEKLGVSLLIEQCQNAIGYMEALCVHVDMVFRYGSDGKFHPKLIRKDYDPLLLPLIDESIVLDEPTFSRKSWIDTINEMKVQFSEILGQEYYGGRDFFPSDDTYLHKEFPDTNYGNSDTLSVYGAYAPYCVHSVLRFDLSQLPSDSQINSAILSLYCFAAAPWTPGRTYSAHKLTQAAWLELQATWNNYKAGSAWEVQGGDYTDILKATATVPSPPDWMNWDVTDLVKQFIALPGQMADFFIKDTNENDPNFVGANFYSSEWAGDPTLKPKLTIQFATKKRFDFLLVAQYALPPESFRDLMTGIDIKTNVGNPVAIDTGNKDIQKRVVSKTIQLALFTTNRNAVWGGKQQLIKASYPFAMINFPANRKVFKYEAGDCFRFSYAAYGISNMICRAIQLEEEGLESENIIISAMEDIFSIANAITEYASPFSLAIPAPDYTVLPFDHQRALEAPYAMSSSVALLPIACRKSDMDLGFEVYMSIDNGISYFILGIANNIRPYGVLVGTYPADTYTIDDEVGLTIEFDNDDVDRIQTATWAEVFSGQKNTAILGNEIISFQSITPISGSQYKLEGIIRGRFGTIKQDHFPGEEFYTINFTSKLFGNEEIQAGANRKFKYLPYNVRQVAPIADCTAIDLLVEGECLKPYIPINFMANGSSFAARYDTDIILTWSPRYRGKGAGIGIPGTVTSESDREGLFKIEVWVGGVKVRTMTSIDDATWTYTEAMNLINNGDLPNSLTFKLSNYRNEDGVLYESDQVTVICKKNAGPLS